MQVALEIRVADLDLEGVVADRRGVSEEFGELAVAEMEIEAGRIGPYAIAPTAAASDEAGGPPAWRRDPTAPPARLRRMLGYKSR